MLAKRPRAEKRGVNDLSPTHVAAEEGKAEYLHLLGESAGVRAHASCSASEVIAQGTPHALCLHEQLETC